MSERLIFVPDCVFATKFIIDPSIDAWLKAGDLVLNIEAPVVMNSRKKNFRYGLNQERQYLDEFLSRYNVVGVSLASNHLFDHGQSGYRETMAYFKSWQIPFTGAGDNSREATNPIILKIGNENIYVFSYSAFSTGARIASSMSSGVASYKHIVRKIKDESLGASKIAVLAHVGCEFEAIPEPIDRDRFTKLLDFADIVIGHHPHRPQGYISSSRGRMAYCSQGNFIFSERRYGALDLKFPEVAKVGYLVCWNPRSGRSERKWYVTRMQDQSAFIGALEDGSCDSYIKKYDDLGNYDSKRFKKIYVALRQRKKRPPFLDESVISTFRMFLYVQFCNIKRLVLRVIR